MEQTQSHLNSFVWEPFAFLMITEASTKGLGSMHKSDIRYGAHSVVVTTMTSVQYSRVADPIPASIFTS